MSLTPEILLAIYLAGIVIGAALAGFFSPKDADSGLFGLMLFWPIVLVVAAVCGCIWLVFKGPYALGQKLSDIIAYKEHNHD